MLRNGIDGSEASACRIRCGNAEKAKVLTDSSKINA